ncbi:microviridin/marinostatin family tricyclic proteinase inhibitor [Olivibacter sp. CPCC 100613]|uniref:microviridin/marinostatin family tricyclic proteinase inhibitor n=1 Tax=Olivibacter sp. CPCC 100613 TaxID=3079931 RepID=UPI002FF7B28B
METKNQMKQPFFARFLEGQTVQNAKNQEGTQQSPKSELYQQPDLNVTLKFPSDSDEGL